MAGKTIDESKAARKLMLEKKRQGTDSSKVPVTVEDVNGCAFTVMINSTQVSSPSHTPEFARLAADPLPMATIDEVEYEGVRGHLSVSLPPLSSPTLPLFICSPSLHLCTISRDYT
jgi:hypothetical protein